MTSAERTALISIPLVILLGAFVAWAGSQGGATVNGFPLFALLVGLAFAVQWLAFIPAWLLQTEKFFDLTGSITYTALVLLALGLRPGADGRSILLAVLVIVWAARLGTFLFGRIKKAGKDDRFDELKPSFLRFLMVWTIQGLWVTFTAAAALVAMTTTTRAELGVFALVGLALWLAGFTIEVVADNQKSRFKADPANRDQFINTGLWSRSRHPNYFGEIVLWLGVAVIALPVLQGWQWIALISPLFVTVLLTRVSGVPMLEEKADRKWGGQDAYEAYKRNTPVLIPRWRVR